MFVYLKGSPSVLPMEVAEGLSQGSQGSQGSNNSDGRSSPQLVDRGVAMHDPDSPCARQAKQRNGVLADPESPSARRRPAAVQLDMFTDQESTDQQCSQMSIPMKKATCQRASRAARANDPSSEATMRAYNLMYQKIHEIKRNKVERAPRETQAFRSFKPSSGSGGKGSAVRTSQQQQSKMNHLASLKAKDVDTSNTEPAFLLGGFTAPMLWDRLAENSLKSNAVNSSVTNRKKTQGAANQVTTGIFPFYTLGQKSGLTSNAHARTNFGFGAWTSNVYVLLVCVPQTTRISCKSIGQAAAAQVCATALAMAHGRYLMRREGMFVVNPMATNAVNLCALALSDTSGVNESSYFCITSTVRLVYNSSPVKVSSVSVLSACMDIARRELDEFYISNAVGMRSNVLIDVCKSIIGDKDMDAVWCSWVLVVYLCSHPRGRDLLRQAGLTDVDIQSAIVFERYGGEEIRRRIRQCKSQADASRKQSRSSSDAGPSVHSDDRAGVAGGSAKRKRSTKSTTSSALSDSHSILEFWHDALQSEYASVLHTLAAHNKRTARDAALSTLATQTKGTDVGDNAVLQSVSLKNAIKSAKALVSFVGRRANDMPTVMLCWVKDPLTGSMRTAAAVMRIDKEAASSALHACTLPPHAVRPCKATKIAIAWSHATKKMMPSTEESAAMPGLLERYARMAELEEADSKRGKGGTFTFSATAIRDTGSMERLVDMESEMAIPCHVTGTTRSFISACTVMCINYTHEQAGQSLVEELKDLHSTHLSIDAPVLKLPQIIKRSQQPHLRSEPLCTPSSPLSVGICANEMLRRWMAGKTRKNDPCKKHLGFSSSSEVSKEMPGIMSSEPLPLLTITDVEMERVGEVRRVSPTMGTAAVAMGIHVCGDGATRLPELLNQLCNQTRHSAAQKCMQEARAALFTAASQASFIGCVASSLASGYTIASVASSKKISVPDVNKIMLLSPFDCYVAGLCNIQRSFDPGPYSGTYGCRVDTGFTMHGLCAHNFRSDNRQHGNCSLSEAAADELALAFGGSHWVVYDNPADRKDGKPPTKYYTSTPIATRGIPHGFIPGIHSVLNSYCSFIETCRKLTGREHRDTVDSIMCLPFSPFTQALNPDVEPTADVSLRTCFRQQAEASTSTGRAYLPDATSEDSAIVKEPLFRRPCQVSSGDCPFATAYEAVDTFFNACNTLALLARAYTMQHGDCEPTASACIVGLHSAITNFVSGHSTPTSNADSFWAADALVLINVLYPSNLAIGELALLNGVAKAAPACHRGLAEGAPVASLDQVPDLDTVDVTLVKTFWASFCRDDASICVWKWALAPFLTLILNHNGSHDTTPETVAQFRSCLENAVRAVWLVYSPDGVSPPPADHPAHDAASPMQVARHHLDPVFVGDQEAGLQQRGCTIGMKPHSYRQILAELLGAGIAGVECNVALNEGGMGLRVSSDCTILDEEGNERTDKSISPVQTEGDESAYGKRQDKLSGAVRQKFAWDCNALLCKPLYTAIEPPMNTEIRGRGEFGFSQFFQTEHAKMAQDGQRMSSSFASAKAMMRAASDPKVANLVNGVL